MKKLFNILMLSAVMFTCVCSADQVMAQAPPAPPATGGGNSGDQPIGGNAPIGGGIILLLAMGAGYAVKKGFSQNKTV
ncbi:MAG: hypothetical protein V1775_05845 [Bacteroidota bacterium]